MSPYIHFSKSLPCEVMQTGGVIVDQPQGAIETYLEIKSARLPSKMTSGSVQEWATVDVTIPIRGAIRGAADVHPIEFTDRVLARTPIIMKFGKSTNAEALHGDILEHWHKENGRVVIKPYALLIESKYQPGTREIFIFPEAVAEIAAQIDRFGGENDDHPDAFIAALTAHLAYHNVIGGGRPEARLQSLLFSDVMCRVRDLVVDDSTHWPMMMELLDDDPRAKETVKHDLELWRKELIGCPNWFEEDIVEEVSTPMPHLKVGVTMFNDLTHWANQPKVDGPLKHCLGLTQPCSRGPIHSQDMYSSLISMFETVPPGTIRLYDGDPINGIGGPADEGFHACLRQAYPNARLFLIKVTYEMISVTVYMDAIRREEIEYHLPILLLFAPVFT